MTISLKHPLKPAMLAGEPEVLLDISRLASRVLHQTPTGVDRVEMAYARELLSAIPDRLGFFLRHPIGVSGRLSTDAARRFLDTTEEAWTSEAPRTHRQGLVSNLKLMPARMGLGQGPRVVVQASPSRLLRTAARRAELDRLSARFVCLVHDLIPIEHPEYAKPGGADLHRCRMETVAALADGVIANSAATARAFSAFAAQTGRIPDTRVALLGTEQAFSRVRPAQAPIPYFVCLGTIEPRKNHLLLLNIWRRLASEGGPIPQLVIVGRRGWENENILDMLDRCEALRGHVVERPGAGDAELRTLLAGARALLMPSFAEGFGMPVTEALAAGAPVIASDLPALREAGAGAPEFIDPLDGTAWLSAIRDYAGWGSPRRNAQLERIRFWSAPRWEDHIRVVLDLVETVAAKGPVR